MPVDLNSKQIDPNDPQFSTMLQNLQGNILKGHGRDHSVHIFLSFTTAGADLRAKFGALATKLVTSAARQRDETAQFKKFGVPGGPFGNVFLTPSGYTKLGLTAAATAGLSDQLFKDGMKAHAAELNDPAPATWEAGYTAEPIDAMLLLADDDVGFLLREARQLVNEITGFASMLQVEHGDALRTQAGEGIEHFGYVDGRSQPIYFAADLAAEGKIDKWDPSEPLGRVLVPDSTTNAPDSFGSYFVFRKLEQNVRGFKVAEQRLADALGLLGTDRERAGAMAVGRFEDGTPLALSMVDGFLPVKENNFQYDVDPDGLKCPFQAHIRKTNPRGDIARKLVAGGSDEVLERSRRITRRGITYGTRAKPPDADQSLDQLPTGGVGLLFMCFQSSISNQFAFMQSSWANNEGFLLGGIGLDPVIGQPPNGIPPALGQNWNPQYGVAGPTVNFSFAQFVTLKGGEFFFAPSIPFLKSL
jgi:Dyp-type peroxidase family